MLFLKVCIILSFRAVTAITGLLAMYAIVTRVAVKDATVVDDLGRLWTAVSVCMQRRTRFWKPGGRGLARAQYYIATRELFA